MSEAVARTTETSRAETVGARFRAQFGGTPTRRWDFRSRDHDVREIVDGNRDALRELGLRGDPPIDEVQRNLVNLIEWQMRLNRGYAQILNPLWKRVRAIARAEGRPVRILDIGAGQGAVLRRLDRRAKREGVALELFAADLDPVYVEHVNARFAREGVPIRAVVADACAMPEVADGAYDIAMHTFLFHHLTPERAAASLAEMDRVSRHGMFVFDLNRGPHVWIGMALGTAPTPHRHARALLHDGLASVRRAYTPLEVRWLLGELGLAERYDVRLQWSPPWLGFAWVLEGRG